MAKSAAHAVSDSASAAYDYARNKLTDLGSARANESRHSTEQSVFTTGNNALHKGGAPYASNNEKGAGKNNVGLQNIFGSMPAGSPSQQCLFNSNIFPLTPTQPTSMEEFSNKYIQKIGDIISGGEGGYESYNTGTRGVEGGRVGHSYLNPDSGTVTGKTIDEILATNDLTGNDTSRMFATGKYQTTIPTLTAAKDKLNLNGDELYTADLQERVFKEYLVGKAGGGVLKKFISDSSVSVDDAQYAASKEWASVAVPSGYRLGDGRISDGYTSYYDHPGQNAANRTSTDDLRSLLLEIDAAR